MPCFAQNQRDPVVKELINNRGAGKWRYSVNKHDWRRSESWVDKRVPPRGHVLRCAVSKTMRQLTILILIILALLKGFQQMAVQVSYARVPPLAKKAVGMVATSKSANRAVCQCWHWHWQCSLRIKRRPEAFGRQKLSRASKFFFFFMFKNLLRMSFGPASSETLMQRLWQCGFIGSLDPTKMVKLD